MKYKKTILIGLVFSAVLVSIVGIKHYTETPHENSITEIESKQKKLTPEVSIKPNFILDQNTNTSLSPIQQAYQNALIERKKAQSVLDDIEKSVSHLEKRLDEIENRGENTLDHENEIFTDFQKIFMAYQDAEAALVAAENAEQKAKLALQKEQSKKVN